MLGLILSCITALQAPAGDVQWIDPGTDAQRSDASVVVGTVELDPAAAVRAARVAAEAVRWNDLMSVGRDRAVRGVPFWYPDAMRDRVVERWAERLSTELPLRVIAREDRVREHGFGRSYQTHLLVGRDEPGQTQFARLARALTQDRRVLLGVAGGSVAFWALLVVAVWWLDRLSRGYMTGRLVVLGLMLALVVPGVAFALV